MHNYQSAHLPAKPTLPLDLDDLAGATNGTYTRTLRVAVERGGPGKSSLQTPRIYLLRGEHLLSVILDHQS